VIQYGRWHSVALQQECAPADWKNGIIIPLPKKGDLSDCGNWRGITLLSVPGKVFSRILLNRMQDAVDQLLRQQQAGFRRGRSCTEDIFTLRQISSLEKVTEGRQPVIVNFIDLRKAFDSIHRPALWKILQLYGLPTKPVTVIQKLYEDNSSAVRVNGPGNTSSWFKVETGVRQSCILSPLLFAIAVDLVLRRTMDNSTGGIKTQVVWRRVIVWLRFRRWHRTNWWLMEQHATDNIYLDERSQQSRTIHLCREM